MLLGSPLPGVLGLDGSTGGSGNMILGPDCYLGPGLLLGEGVVDPEPGAIGYQLVIGGPRLGTKVRPLSSSVRLDLDEGPQVIGMPIAQGPTTGAVYSVQFRAGGTWYVASRTNTLIQVSIAGPLAPTPGSAAVVSLDCRPRVKCEYGDSVTIEYAQGWIYLT